MRFISLTAACQKRPPVAPARMPRTPALSSNRSAPASSQTCNAPPTCSVRLHNGDYRQRNCDQGCRAGDRPGGSRIDRIAPRVLAVKFLADELDPLATLVRPGSGTVLASMPWSGSGSGIVLLAVDHRAHHVECRPAQRLRFWALVLISVSHVIGGGEPAGRLRGWCVGRDCGVSGAAGSSLDTEVTS